MTLLLKSAGYVDNPHIQISGSKSETNRLLILQALFPQIVLENISDSDDSILLSKALNSTQEIIDIGHAGTAMRFLTSYFALLVGRTVTLTGSHRMKERPIGYLVDALRELGSEIKYLEKEGFPPIRISGQKFTKNKVALEANISSQYVTALLLIAPKLEDGLEIELLGDITSRPYIEMTLGMLSRIGIEYSFNRNTIKVSEPKSIRPTKIECESDWSSASYFYSIIALSKPGTTLTLSSFNEKSIQGDSLVKTIYKDLGVKTTFEGGLVKLLKIENRPSDVNLDLNDTPDLAQTIAVTCLGLGIGCELNGLHTLKIKETNRLSALHTELTKLGADVSITNDSLTLKPHADIDSNVTISTYKDHRMAMAFAPLAVLVPIKIEDAEVVSKSYRNFWNDLSKVGLSAQKTE
ncbi:MAG TPA: 3-phosphoshikimate 1-carboxyvinyltransferase [Flavobacterium sp.]|jgi:3-phosphoshikimate 1-carboxyvinyltransferase